MRFAASTASSQETAVPLRLPQAQFFQQFLEALPVLCPVDAVGRRTEDGNAQFFEGRRKLERRLSAELDDHAHRPFSLYNMENVFQCQGFEIEAVRRIVVRADCFGVAVHHDGFETIFLERKGGMDAAVVELDAPGRSGSVPRRGSPLSYGRSGLPHILPS